MLWLSMISLSLVLGEPREYEDPEERPVEREAEFTSIPTKVMINEGDTIRLPCFVDKIEGYVLLWKFGETILSVGGRVIDSSRERRLVLEEETNGNFLVINSALSSDGGDYMCQISAYRPKDITHSVLVRTRPKVQVEKGEVTVAQGDNVTLQCNVVGGHPVPEVTWFKDGAEEVLYEYRLSLGNVSRGDSGQYICRGDNGFTTDHTQTVQLLVEHPPVVEQRDMFIHSSQGGDVTLVCEVVSHPSASVEWFAGDQLLDVSTQQYNLSRDEDHGTEVHTLQVDIQPTANSSLEVHYSCVASNSLGSSKKIITISSRPGVPTLESDQQDSLQLQWEVISEFPVTSFILEIAGIELSREVQVTEVGESNNSTWTGLYNVEGLRDGTIYKARVRAINQHGRGPVSNWLEFQTLGEEISGSVRACVASLVALSVLVHCSCSC